MKTISLKIKNIEDNMMEKYCGKHVEDRRLLKKNIEDIIMLETLHVT